MKDHIKEAVSKLDIPKVRPRWLKMLSRLGGILWGGLLFCVVSLLLGGIVGFAVVGYKVATSWL